MRRLLTLCLLLVFFVLGVATVAAQEDGPRLTVNVGREFCPLAVSGTTLSLVDGCEDFLFALRVPQNGVLWLSFREPFNERFLPVEAFPDDDNPPEIDPRGRFFGCQDPNLGTQNCRVRVIVDGTAYSLELPLIVEAEWEGGIFAPTISERGTVERIFEGYACRQVAEGRYRWYRAVVTYEDGEPVFVEVVAGPFFGRWRLGCPLGEGAPAAPAMPTMPATTDTAPDPVPDDADLLEEESDDAI